jgi:hypothetical protein
MAGNGGEGPRGREEVSRGDTRTNGTSTSRSAEPRREERPDEISPRQRGCEYEGPGGRTGTPSPGSAARGRGASAGGGERGAPGDRGSREGQGPRTGRRRAEDATAIEAAEKAMKPGARKPWSGPGTSDRTGNRQQATGNRQQATGNRQQATYARVGMSKCRIGRGSSPTGSGDIRPVPLHPRSRALPRPGSPVDLPRGAAPPAPVRVAGRTPCSGGRPHRPLPAPGLNPRRPGLRANTPAPLRPRHPEAPPPGWSWPALTPPGTTATEPPRPPPPPALWGSPVPGPVSLRSPAGSRVGPGPGPNAYRRRAGRGGPGGRSRSAHRSPASWSSASARSSARWRARMPSPSWSIWVRQE